MNRKYFQRPFYCLFIPAFFVLHIVNEYFGLLSPGLIFQYFLWYLLGTLIILVIGKIWFRNWIPAGIWTLSIQLIFFFFGATHDLLKSWFPLSFLVSYRFLLPFIFLIISGVSLLLRMQKRLPRKLPAFFNLLTIVLVLVECLNLLLHSFEGADKINDFSRDAPDAFHRLKICDSCRLPDLFFIVFDEYPSSLALREVFHFDNHPLDSFLESGGYHILPISKSNYNSTPLSLASTFNMEYLPGVRKEEPTTTRSMLQAWYTYRKNRLIPFLESNGYEIRNMGIANFPHHPISGEEFFKSYERKVLYYETLYGRIKRDVFWNFRKWNFPLLADYIDKSEEEENQFIIHLNESNYQFFMDELKKKRDKPRFVLAHFLLPHQPFLFDKNGKRIREFRQDEIDTTKIKQIFIGQLQFTNQWIQNITDSIEANRRADDFQVVVLEGDHGFRQFDFVPKEIQFRNLNSIYFPDKDYSKINDSMSTVNTFRVIMNRYFGAELPLLKDSSILLK